MRICLVATGRETTCRAWSCCFGMPLPLHSQRIGTRFWNGPSVLGFVLFMWFIVVIKPHECASFLGWEVRAGRVALCSCPYQFGLLSAFAAFVRTRDHVRIVLQNGFQICLGFRVSTTLWHCLSMWWCLHTSRVGITQCLGYHPRQYDSVIRAGCASCCRISTTELYNLS